MSDVNEKLAESLRQMLSQLAQFEPHARGSFQIARATLSAYESRKGGGVSESCITKMCVKFSEVFYVEQDDEWIQRRAHEMKDAMRAALEAAGCGVECVNCLRAEVKEKAAQVVSLCDEIARAIGDSHE